MRNRILAATALLALTVTVSACGSSSSSSTTTTQSTASKQQLKTDATAYQAQIKTLITGLASCAAGALVGGDSGGAQKCLDTFVSGVSSNTTQLKQSVESYVNTASGPCKADLQKMADDSQSLATALKGATGGGLSKAVTAVSDPATQAKLSAVEQDFNALAKSCKDIFKN